MGHVPLWYNPNWPVSSQKARSLNFFIQEEGELHYLRNKNEDTDQLCSYCTADLPFLFLPLQIVLLCGDENWLADFVFHHENMSM